MLLKVAFELVLIVHLLQVAVATITSSGELDACPGYKAENIVDHGHLLSADLVLNGRPCNIYGDDIHKLHLQVTYESGESRPPRSVSILASVGLSWSPICVRLDVMVLEPTPHAQGGALHVTKNSGERLDDSRRRRSV